MLTEKELVAMEKIIQFEASIPDDAFNEEQPFQLGWSWRDVGVMAMILNNLVAKGCLKTLYHSNNYTGYRLSDEGRQIYELEKSESNEPGIDVDMVIPDNIFDIIEGYDDIKEMFLKSLMGEPVDFLMIGPPGSAKTMFLSELERIQGSLPMILGGTATKVGIVDVLFDYKPKIITLDELEHMDSKDYTVLLSLCESRVVSETKHGKTRRIELPETRLFAGCNSTRAIPEPVLDRLQKVRFASYTYDQYIRIVINTLVKREGVENSLAEYIATKSWEISHSVRQAMRMAKLAKTIEEVDRLIKVMEKYSIH